MAFEIFDQVKWIDHPGVYMIRERALPPSFVGLNSSERYYLIDRSAAFSLQEGDIPMFVVPESQLVPYPG